MRSFLHAHHCLECGSPVECVGGLRQTSDNAFVCVEREAHDEYICASCQKKVAEFEVHAGDPRR